MIEPSPRKYWYRGRSWLCSECGKRIAKAKTPIGSVKGLLSIHAKWKHPGLTDLNPIMEEMHH